MNAMADRPRRLESYVGGMWTRGAKDGVALLDASTGAPVALIDSSGIDFAAALAYGREKAGPKLRRMSFHERAVMIKALAQALMERKEEFYALSTATGATRRRHRHAVFLRLEGQAGAAEHARSGRWRRGSPVA
jgi:oxepin-CoA hydrolase / 3-oxo-5,6-dehydrosuberyl-CoA semialdehyde dehydrogenase